MTTPMKGIVWVHPDASVEAVRRMEDVAQGLATGEVRVVQPTREQFQEMKNAVSPNMADDTFWHKDEIYIQCDPESIKKPTIYIPQVEVH